MKERQRVSPTPHIPAHKSITPNSCGVNQIPRSPVFTGAGGDHGCVAHKEAPSSKKDPCVARGCSLVSLLNRSPTSLPLPRFRSCSGYSLHRTSHPSGLRHLRKLLQDPFLPQADQKNFGSRSCPFNRYRTDLMAPKPSRLVAHDVGGKEADNYMSRLERFTNQGLWLKANATAGSPLLPNTLSPSKATPSRIT